MTRVDQIVLGGTTLEARDRLLQFLVKHADRVFSLSYSDVLDIRAWLTDPEGDEPPPAYDESATYSMTAIRRALRTLRSQKKIAAVELNGRMYYGTPAAIRRLRKLVSKPRRTRTGATHKTQEGG